MRPLVYPQTDVFLCCYDMRNSRGEELTETYVPEIQQILPGALFWTVGTLGDEEHELALDLKWKENDSKKYEPSYVISRLITSAAAAANDPPKFADPSSFYMGHVSGCVRTKEGEGENSPRSVLQSVVRKHILREEEKKAGAAAANTCFCVLQ